MLVPQIPDVYDSAKYDAIHNAHLQLEGLAELLPLSKLLADGVVPNEYGTHPHSKLRIGATIAAELLKKLLIDLSNTRDETFHASRAGGGGAEPGEAGGGATGTGGGIDTCNISSWQRGVMAERAARAAAEAAASAASSATAATPRPASDSALGAAGEAALEAAAGASEADPEAADETRDDLEDSEEDEQSTRLHPGAADVNSPHRHVRTRVYLTSESHIHSLISVLRYAHLEPPPVAPPPSRPGSSMTLAESEVESLGDIYAGKWWRSGSGPVFGAGASATPSAPTTPAGPGAASAPLPAPKPLLSHEADDTLAATPEFDYLSQIVFRMYERFDYPVTHPQRFRLELSFSRGAAVDWARAPPPAASGGGGGGGSGSAVTLPLPEAAYAGALFTRTPLQCDAGGSRGAPVPPAAEGGAAEKSSAAGEGADGFLTLARAEATLWRFGRQPAQRHLSSGLPPLPPSAAPHAPPAPTPPPAEDAAAAGGAPRPAAAVALLGRLSGAQ